MGAAALFAGCGAQNAATLPQAHSTAHSRARGTSASYADLLYVTAGNQGVAVLTYPQGKFLEYISNDAVGLCSDASGNVWLTTYSGYAVEYAHGGSTPIADLYVGFPAFVTDCSVDATTGSVALIVPSTPGGFVMVFPPSGGTGIQYTTPFTSSHCAYDNNGNLFIAGFAVTSDDLKIAELPKGGSNFSTLSIDKTGKADGSIHWDGKYMAVSTQASEGHVVYRFTVQGSQATVVQTVRFTRQVTGFFWIQGHVLIAARRVRGDRFNPAIALWHYPRGGRAFSVLGQWGDAITVSVVPSGTRTRE
jgi:hypothetical protein